MIDFGMRVCYNKTVTKYAHSTWRLVQKNGFRKNNIKISNEEEKIGQKTAFAGKRGCGT